MRRSVPRDPGFGKTPRWFTVAAIVSTVIGLAFWVTVVFVAGHFVMKWW